MVRLGSDAAFAIEDVVAPHVLDHHRDEPVEERWEHVVTATIFTTLAMVLPTLWLARMIRERERGRRALVESEQRFRDFAESAGDRYWETGPGIKSVLEGLRLAGLPEEWTRAKTEQARTLAAASATVDRWPLSAPKTQQNQCGRTDPIEGNS